MGHRSRSGRASPSWRADGARRLVGSVLGQPLAPYARMRERSASASSVLRRLGLRRTASRGEQHGARRGSTAIWRSDSLVCQLLSTGASLPLCYRVVALDHRPHRERRGFKPRASTASDAPRSTASCVARHRRCSSFTPLRLAAARADAVRCTSRGSGRRARRGRSRSSASPAGGGCGRRGPACRVRGRSLRPAGTARLPHRPRGGRSSFLPASRVVEDAPKRPARCGSAPIASWRFMLTIALRRRGARILEAQDAG